MTGAMVGAKRMVDPSILRNIERTLLQKLTRDLDEREVRGAVAEIRIGCEYDRVTIWVVLTPDLEDSLRAAATEAAYEYAPFLYRKYRDVGLEFHVINPSDYEEELDSFLPSRALTLPR